MKKMNLIIYTDLDGTLLDHDTYSYREATPALNEIKKKEIPLIFCTSKTRAEIEVYRRELSLKDPFISENGGAIFIPEGYFPKEGAGRITGGYTVIELGSSYDKLRGVLDEIKSRVDCRIVGFGDMAPEEVSRDCGISLGEAGLAKKREYDEAFKIEGTDEEKEEVLNLIKESGFHYTKGGRYYHLIGGNDKGKAVRILTDLYKKQYPKVKAIALGDSGNDYPMLDNVDIPVLIKRPGGYAGFERKGLIRSNRVGPAGWNDVIPPQSSSLV
jgi:mannosyl-3-phosphoglycerate phosphatase